MFVTTYSYCMMVLFSFPLLRKYLDTHPHLFAVDPLLLHFVVYVTPLEAYSELVTKVPLFILLSALEENLSKGPRDKV